MAAHKAGVLSGRMGMGGLVALALLAMGLAAVAVYACDQPKNQCKCVPCEEGCALLDNTNDGGSSDVSGDTSGSFSPSALYAAAPSGGSIALTERSAPLGDGNPNLGTFTRYFSSPMTDGTFKATSPLVKATLNVAGGKAESLTTSDGRSKVIFGANTTVIKDAEGLTRETQTLSGGKVVAIARGKLLLTTTADTAHPEFPSLIVRKLDTTTIERTYFHYTNAPNGLFVSRKRITVQEFNSDGTSQFATTIYGYYPSDDSAGKHRMKDIWYIVRPDGVVRYLSTHLADGIDASNPSATCNLDSTVSDATLAGFADIVYNEYDSQHRVTKLTSSGGSSCCGGGSSGEGVYTYAYGTAGGTGFNAWKTYQRTIAPGGLVTTEFRNEYGQVIFAVEQDLTTHLNWVTHNKYFAATDGFAKQGRIQERRYPSACAAANYTVTTESHGWATNVTTTEAGTKGLVRMYDYDVDTGLAVSEKVREGVSAAAGTWIRQTTYTPPHIYAEGPHGTGSILREAWNNIPGTTVASLVTATTGFTRTPTVTTWQTSFDAPQGYGSNYGQRMRGYIYPPTTGNYIFYIAGDDNCQLYLSTSSNPNSKLPIASVPSYTGFHQWTKDVAHQKSAAIALTAGQKYYIEAIEKQSGGSDSLSVAWQTSDSSVPVVIDGFYLEPYISASASGGGTGLILREYWGGIGGSTVASLTSNANFPNNPTGTAELTALDMQGGYGSNYGTRLRGYLCPSTTGGGNYTFWIAGDDNCQLYLSTDDTSANKQLRASVSGYTKPYEWTKSTGSNPAQSQQSVSIGLQSGHKYYIEVLHKQGGGSDHVEVAWQGPDTGGVRRVVSGAFLSPYDAGRVHTQSVRLVQTEIAYPVGTTNGSDSSALATSHTYTYYHDTGGAETNAVEVEKVTYPAVASSQNGSGTSACAEFHFYRDATNNLYYRDWTRQGFYDGQSTGTFSYSELGTAWYNFGQVTRSIEDVNSATGLHTPPTGWSIPAGGLNLTTTYAYFGTGDAGSYGRVKSVTGPGGRKAGYAYMSQNAASGVNTTTTAVVTLIAMMHNSDYSLAPEQIAVSDLAGHGIISAVGSPNSGTSTDGDLSNDWTVTAGTLETAFAGTIRSKTVSTYDKSKLIRVDQYSDPTSPATALGTVYAYNTAGLLDSVTAPDGTINRTTYDVRGRSIATFAGTNTASLGQVSATYYDEAVLGSGTSGVGDGYVTHTMTLSNSGGPYHAYAAYDFRGRLQRNQGPDGVGAVHTFDNFGRDTRVETYAAVTLSGGTITVATTGLRAKNETSFDARGQAWQAMTYAVNPNNGTVGHSLTSVNWFDASGRLAKTASANGLFTKTAYDGAGRATATYLSFQDGETSYADALTVAGDTVVEESQFKYDDDGQLKLAAHYQRTDTNTTTQGSLESSGSANARRTYAARWYDDLGRTTTVGDYGDYGGSAMTDRPAEPSIGAAGVLLTKFEYDPATGRQDRTLDNAGTVTQRVFDALGRTVRVVENCQYARAAVGLSFTPSAGDNAINRTTGYEYDNVGRLATLIAFNPKGSSVEQQQTRYVYGDSVNHSLVIAVVYPDAGYTTMGRDSNNAWVLPNGATNHIAFTYDRLGRRFSVTDQRGVVHAYSYDSAGRFEADDVTSLGGGGQNVDGSVRRIDRVYDDLGRVLSVTSRSGTGGGATAVSGVLLYYDSWGNVTASRQNHQGGPTTNAPLFQYAFNDGAVGGVAKYVRLLYVSYDEGDRVFYQYGDQVGDIHDRLSRVRSITNLTGTSVYAQYTYLGAGSVVAVSHPAAAGSAGHDLLLTFKGASAGSYTGFDSFGRVLSQPWGDPAGSGTDLDHFTYTYDAAGNRTSRQNELTHTPGPAFDELYTYDGLSRLTSAGRGTLVTSRTALTAAPVFSQDWGLDVLGNWASFDQAGSGVPSLNQTRSHSAANAVTAFTSAPSWYTPPSYDLAGNMTAGPTPGSEDNAQHLKYDAWNRLVEVDDQRPSLIATYRYDGLGRRISKTLASGDVTDYYYDEAWQVLQEYTVAANQTETVNVYVWDLRYIDAPVVRATYNNDTESLDNWLYYCNDANMNVTSLVASVQGVPTVVERYTYTPYGQPTFRQADGSLTHVSGHADGTASALAVANEILYCGYRYDTETGLYHVRHRAYHSTVGRWMQRDPITLDGSGWYRYVEDRPLDRTDAGGLAAAPPKNGVVTNCFAGCAARYYYCMGCTSVGAGKLSTTLWVFTSWEYSGGEACRHCLWTCLSKCKKEGVPAFPCCMSGCDNGRLTAVSAQNPQQTVVKGLKETVGYIIADAGADAATKGAGGTVGLTAILQGIGMAPDLFDAWMKLQIKDYLLEHNLAASMNMDLLYADPDFVYTLIMSLQNRGMLRVAPYIIQTKQFPFSGRF